MTKKIGTRKIEVILNETPYRTDEYLRIGYAIKTWEYEKDGLKLESITVVDAQSGATLEVLEGAALPFVITQEIYRAAGFSERLCNYYLSINLPIPPDQAPPARIAHRFTFADTKKGGSLVVEGGAFSPRLEEFPEFLGSPVRGRNLLFFHHSSNGYHFFNAFFVGRSMFTGQRYAVDAGQLDDALSGWADGDPTQNESYFAYKHPVYAVAGGTVVRLVDGCPENHGNLRDVPMPPALASDVFLGNFLVLDIGHGRYAHYAHLVPGSFRVKLGDRIEKGAVLARLGNSGNSGYPHLHFALTDGPETFLSRGLPFVLEQCVKVGRLLAPFDSLPQPSGIRQEPETFQERLLEEVSVFEVE